MFADDTTFSFHCSQESGINNHLTTMLSNAKLWCNFNRLHLKEEEQIEICTFALNKQDINAVKFPGICIERKLSCINQTESMCVKFAKSVFATRTIEEIAEPTASLTTYFGLFHSTLSYVILG